MAVSPGKGKDKPKNNDRIMLMLICTISCCLSIQLSEPNFGGRDSKTAHKKVAY
jgi:hypothetical protein